MKKVIIPIIVVLLLILGANSIYIVNEDELAVVSQFSEIQTIVVNRSDLERVENNLTGTKYSNIAVYNTKGLHVKIPFIQNVTTYTSKYLTYKSLPELINTIDGRRIEISMYAQYRVVDPAKFYVAVGSKSKANARMDELVYKTVINVANTLEFNQFFSQNTLEDLLDTKRESLNDQMVEQFGIFISDIGIYRKSFPTENISTIEEKMTKEIQKDSEKTIAEGDSQYNQKVAQVDAQKAQTIADAIETAAVIKAEADAQAIRTYQESLQVDLEFYQFIQRMEIYKTIKGSTVFLDQDNDIFEYLNENIVNSPAGE